MKLSRRKIKIVLKALKKVSGIRFFIIAFLLLVTNTFAWFVYSRTVESGVVGRVKAWKVTFEADDEQLEDYVNIHVPDIYPGMDDFEQNVSARNESEVPVGITYVLLSANIVGEEYITKEGHAYYEDGLESDLTSKQLIESLLNDYPFKIGFILSSNTMDAVTGKADVTVKVSWGFEDNSDEIDTYWGAKAYDFQSENPEEACISLDLLIRIQQVKSN